MQRLLACSFLISVWLGFVAPQSALASDQTEVTYGAGEKLWLRLDNTISSKTAQVGEHVEARLHRPRTATVARVLGSVTAARPANKAHRVSSRLTLVFNQVVLTDGRIIPMDGSIVMDGSAARSYGFGWQFTAALGMGLMGGVVGGIVGGATGGEVGVPIGSFMGWVPLALASQRKWRDVNIKHGRSFPVELGLEIRLPIVVSPKP